MNGDNRLLIFRKNIGLFVAGFFIGVGLGTFLGFSLANTLFFSLLSFSFFVLAFLFTKTFKFYLACAFLCLGLFLGLFRIGLAILPVSNFLPTDEKITLAVKIIAEPDERLSNTQLIVQEQETKEKILLLVDRFPRYQYGDEIIIKGKLSKPQNFITDSGKEFDYQKYLLARGINYQMFKPDIILISSKSKFNFIVWLFSLKHHFIDNLNYSLPEPQVSLMNGLLLGAKSGLGDEVSENFRRVGLSHIVVLSGYNISIVATFILRGLFFLSQTLSLVGGVAGIIIFALLVGAGPAVIRASIMAILALLARGYGRIYEAGIALIFAGLLMILWNPSLLVYDIGFQLSFLATLGIIYITPFWEKVLYFIPTKLAGRELVATTLGAQTGVLPWLIYQLGDLSVISLPANLLVLPIIPWTMLFGFLTGLISFVSQILALPFAYLSYFLLSYILFLAKFLSSLAFASVPIKNFPWWLVIIVYVVIFLVLLKSKDEKKNLDKTDIDNFSV